ncbi:hypothetical protein [Streptomyces alkaliterrae]|uniref:hypothetical protein n=1 Tax=Streptomyces alkaliterrae TaxID=2213162 RepID=UPI001627FDE5|nr:hypothetical protein [Streptomyces alkaliterrae]
MTYAVTVDVGIPDGTQQLDELQREGAASLLVKGLESVYAIEGPDGVEVEITDCFVGTHPEGAVLGVTVDALSWRSCSSATIRWLSGGSSSALSSCIPNLHNGAWRRPAGRRLHRRTRPSGHVATRRRGNPPTRPGSIRKKSRRCGPSSGPSPVT